MIYYICFVDLIQTFRIVRTLTGLGGRGQYCPPPPRPDRVKLMPNQKRTQKNRRGSRELIGHVHQDFALLSLHLNIKKRIIFKNITFFQLHLLMVITCITKLYSGTRGTLTNLAGKLYTSNTY